MSDRRYAPDGSGFDDDEWDEAYRECLRPLIDAGWPEDEAEKRVDDLMVADMAAYIRRGRDADERRAREKEWRYE